MGREECCCCAPRSSPQRRHFELSSLTNRAINQWQLAESIEQRARVVVAQRSLLSVLITERRRRAAAHRVALASHLRQTCARRPTSQRCHRHSAVVSHQVTQRASRTALPLCRSAALGGCGILELQEPRYNLPRYCVPQATTYFVVRPQYAIANMRQNMGATSRYYRYQCTRISSFHVLLLR